VLGVAILVKIFLGLFFKKTGKDVKSETLKASGTDALFDAVISTSVLVGAVIFILSGLNIEAWLGAVISLFILKSGFEVLKDATGEILETGENYPDREAILRAAAELTGDIRQVPSMYSAIKVGGKPLYLRARKGENVDVPERIVHIESIEVLREMPDHGVEIRVRCGKGTYIRSLARDIGEALGSGAFLTALCRTRLGDVRIEDCLTLDDFPQWLEQQEIEKN
jgi:hypothetical protein